MTADLIIPGAIITLRVVIEDLLIIEATRVEVEGVVMYPNPVLLSKTRYIVASKKRGPRERSALNTRGK